MRKEYERPVIKKEKMSLLFRLLGTKGRMWYISYVLPAKAYNDYWKEIAPRSVILSLFLRRQKNE